MPAHRAVSLSDEHPEPEPHDSEARASFTGVTGGVMWPRPASQGYQAGSPIDCVVEGPGRAVLSNMRSSSSSAVAGRCSASPERMGTSGGPRFGAAGNIANKHTCSAALHHDMACVCDGARSELRHQASTPNALTAADALNGGVNAGDSDWLAEWRLDPETGSTSRREI